MPPWLTVSVLVLVLLLAGCTTPDEEPPAPGATDEPAPAPVRNPGAAPRTTAPISYVPLPDEQTLFVSGATGMNGTPPTGAMPDRVAFPAGTTGGSLRWSYTLTADAYVDGGEAVFWIDVPQDAWIIGVPGPDGRFCPWTFGMVVREPGSTHIIGNRCPAQPSPQVQAGLHEVRIPLHLLTTYPKDAKAGGTWEFTLSSRLGKLPDEAAPAVLYGAPDAASGITLYGLREPFPRPAPVPCHVTFDEDVRGRASLSPTDHSIGIASSGAGFSISLRNVTDLETMRFAASWNATDESTERLEIRLHLDNETESVEGQSPLVVDLQAERLAGATTLRGSVWLAGDGPGAAASAVDVDLIATKTRLCPLPPGWH